MKRDTDLIEFTLENIEVLEFQFKQSLNSETGAYTMASVEIKNRLDALRIAVCEELKASIMKQKRKNKKAA